MPTLDGSEDSSKGKFRQQVAELPESVLQAMLADMRILRNYAPPALSASPARDIIRRILSEREAAAAEAAAEAQAAAETEAKAAPQPDDGPTEVSAEEMGEETPPVAAETSAPDESGLAEEDDAAPPEHPATAPARDQPAADAASPIPQGPTSFGLAEERPSLILSPRPRPSALLIAAIGAGLAILIALVAVLN